MTSKKDYIAIARAICGSTSIRERNRLVKDHTINHLVDIFSADNSRFDEDKFREACKTVYD